MASTVEQLRSILRSVADKLRDMAGGAKRNADNHTSVAAQLNELKGRLQNGSHFGYMVNVERTLRTLIIPTVRTSIDQANYVNAHVVIATCEDARLKTKAFTDSAAAAYKKVDEAVAALRDVAAKADVARGAIVRAHGEVRKASSGI